LNLDYLFLGFFEFDPLLHTFVSRLLDFNRSVEVLDNMLKPGLCLVDFGQFPLEDIE